MSTIRQSNRNAVESIDARPLVSVLESEYRRLLGYPKDYEPGDRARELMTWARDWFAEHGRPWVYSREAAVEISDTTLGIDGRGFRSEQLRAHLAGAGCRRVVLVAVSAGTACEEHAAQLWREAKPDEYFFLEMFGSAVVEQLVASVNGRVCEQAEHGGLVAVPHYSPGYTGWDVADQPELFELITRGQTRLFPEPVEVLASGMLRPKKSLLAVIGLTARTANSGAQQRSTPCERCAFAPCNYRRARYRHERMGNYSVNVRALKKWAVERVRVERLTDGSVAASFRFDGTTCTNMGQALAFDYSVTLSSADGGFTIETAECRPSAGDEGYRLMCAYLRDADGLMEVIRQEKPLLGRRLDEVLDWQRPSVPAGCYCEEESRAHKWGLALEAIHYSLSQSQLPSVR